MPVISKGITAQEAAVLYTNAIRAKVSQGSLTGLLGNRAYVDMLTSDLRNYREVKRYHIDYRRAGLLDYKGSYPEVAVDMTWVTHKLEYDRALKLVFDKLEVELDGNRGGIDLGTILGNIVDKKVVPEIDATNIERMWQALATVPANIKQAPTKATIVNDLLVSIKDLQKRDMSVDDFILYISADTYFMLTEALREKSNTYLANMEYVGANGISYTLPSIESIPIQKMPDSRFYTKLVRYTKEDYEANNKKVGYAKATDGLAIAYMFVPKDYVYPIVKLNDMKIKMDGVDNTTNRNNEAAVNMYFDCIVESQFSDAFIGATTTTVAKSSDAKSNSDNASGSGNSQT